MRRLIITGFAVVMSIMPAMSGVICSGDSNPVKVSAFESTVNRTLTIYAAPWVGPGESVKVEVDGKCLFSTTNQTETTCVWQPQTLGPHTLTCTLGANVFEKMVNVVELDFWTQPAPNPPMEKDTNISIYPLTDYFDVGGGGLAISTSGSGTWTAVASEPWITLNSTSGIAGKPLAFRVSANTNVEERTAYIYVSGHVYTATQAGVGATVDKSNETFEHNGGFGTVNVTAQNRIVWQARPNVDWISVSPTSGSGKGSIEYQVAPFNEVSTRQGTMTVAGNTVTVFQYGRRMKLATYEEKRDWYTHVIPITVDALAITEWSVTPNASWISVVDAGNGKGGDLVSIAISENPSYKERVGTVTIGTETFTVTQDGRTDLEISIDPVESEASVNGANALLSVYATPDLPWTVTSDSSWVTIYDKFKNGAGNGNIVYTVSPNSTLYDRTATVSVIPEDASGMPTRTHTVTQPAAESAISINGYEFEASGESCSVEVSVADIVEWKIEENLDWITINGSIARMGSGTVVIQAAANDTVYPRSGTITIARKTFTVTQKARGVEVEYEEMLFNARGGSSSVSIHPDGNVAWTVEVSDDWIIVWGDESGTGDAEIEYMVAAWNDEGSSRTGWIKIGDKTIYITQRAYDLSISPNGKKVTGNNGAGEIGVSASIGDVWNAIVTEPWITIVDGYDSGTGSGTVRFIYTENNTGKTRTGKIIVAGEVYTLEQAARTMVAITATAGRGGKVSGGGSYDLGSEVMLTAIPDDGYKFSYWTGDVSTMQNPIKVTADVAKSVTAVFEPLPIAFESVTSGTDGVRLSWNNLAWATTYRIYRGVTSVPSSATVLVEIVNTGNCTYLDESGGVGTTYWYWIEAEGAEDSVMSDPMTGMKQKPVVISPITYQNLRGATHTNPSSYQEGTLVSFANLSGVTGYTFAGWTPERITEDMTGPQTVRANWIADKFNVKFNANGGTGDEVRVLEYGGAFGALPVPVKPYYRFIGWFTSPDGGERIFESSIVAGATELFARWELNTVTANINGVEWVALCNDGVAMLGIGMENNNPAISTSHDGDIVVPEEINGCPVVEIGEYAFDGCSRLTSVTVPNSVTNIAEGAFSGCSSLTNMVLPFVGSERGNFGTREAVFGYVFGADSFEGGTLLRQYFGDGDAYTVNYCIPDKLKSVKITDEEKLGWGAFYGCRMLTEIDINEGIEYIGSFSFRNCTGISELVIPTTVEVIRHNAFRGSGIIKIVVPESVKSIEDRVFDSCSRLTNVTVQNSVTNIAEGAFRGCSSLTNMVLPFIGAARQSALPLYTTKASFGYIFGKNSYEGGVATAQEWTNGLSVTYYIPASLASVTILDETETGGNAFRNCGNLKTVILNEGLRRIRGSTFYNCKSLTEVYIPETVETIIASAFYGCRNLEQIFIPASVDDIGSSAFRDCSALTAVLFEGNAPTVGGSCFYGVNAMCVARVSRKTSGWTVDAEGRWNGLILEYIETEQDLIDELKDFADSKLAEYIKDGKSYAAFLTWVSGLKGVSFDQIKTSPNAWLSYALDLPALIEGDMSEERLKVISFEPMEDNLFAIRLGLDGADTGDNADAGNLMRSFAVEGTQSLEEDGFSVTNVAVEAALPEAGAVTFAVAPRVESDSFFFRTRLLDGKNGVNRNGCPVSFDLGTGGVLPNGVSSQIYVPYTGEYGTLPVPVREGYKFLGWFSAPEGGEKVDAESKMGFDFSKTLYAQWEKTYVYCVIDLSAGPNATSYAVSFLDAVPAGGWTDEYKTTKLVLRRIESGTLKIDDSQSDIAIDAPYCIGVFEVTQKQYELVTGDKPSMYSGDMLPVEKVPWDIIRGDSSMYDWPTVKSVDPNSFVGKLQARTRLRIDLPYEMQWEYACRAGATTAYSYGDSPNGDYMWYLDNAGDMSHYVGTRFPNSWGLFDMHGNVWERCLDSYSTSELKRCNRGGAFNSPSSRCISSARTGTIPALSNEYFGFRLAMDANVQIITFDANDGKEQSTIVRMSGDALGELPTLTREGYAFAGWWTAASGGTQVTASTVVTGSVTYYAHWEEEEWDSVQLWEGGPYWATTNIGAEKPEDYGYYFWWGDTVGYKREDDKWVASDGSNSNFSFTEGNTPTDNKNVATLQSEGWITSDSVLASEYDAAQAHWGGDWRMPTEQEFDDLNSKCDWTWGSMNGVNGYVVRGRGDYSSASIFLPCAGYGFGTSLYLAGAGGFYWSSVPRSDYGSAWGLGFDSGVHGTDGSSRLNGQSVRPLQGFTK